VQEIFIDVPPQDENCRTLIRTLVWLNDQNCGGNVIIAEGATCAPITIDNTFITSICCGIGDCTDAGAPGRVAGSSGILVLHNMQGNIIEPKSAALLQSAEEKSAEV
jgi:hypothetical protein